jgi:hypothetical protein
MDKLRRSEIGDVTDVALHSMLWLWRRALPMCRGDATVNTTAPELAS